MFNTSVLDVAIGKVFIYLLLSLSPEEKSKD